MHVWLTRDKGYKVGRNRIERRHYKVMGLRAVLQGRHTSKRNRQHKTYPFLLRNLDVTRPNQIRVTDITYIPMKKGYMYLMAIIDLHSRFTVHWSVSNSMDVEWCARTLEESIDIQERPEVINTDPGSQFTSYEFTAAVLGREIKLSMDGKGRATDNAFITRLWRSVKYE